MSKIGDNKIITLPESTDLVSLEGITGALQDLEDCAAHGIAVQSNTSTKAYATNVPFQSYYNGMRLQFIARYANTGAATLNINGKGAKKLLDASGVQLSAAGAIQAYSVWWIEYDSTLDGGAGAFKCILLTDDGNNVKLTGNQTVAGTKTFNDPIVAADTVSPISGAKFMITPEGGFAVKLTNKTGGASVKGNLLKISTTTGNAVALCGTSARDIAGFMYSNGVSDGSDVWVVTSGIAPVLMESDQAATRGEHCVISRDEAGRAYSMSNPSDSDYFCGRFLDNIAAGGLGSVLIAWRQDG